MSNLWWDTGFLFICLDAGFLKTSFKRCFRNSWDIKNRLITHNFLSVLNVWDVNLLDDVIVLRLYEKWPFLRRDKPNLRGKCHDVCSSQMFQRKLIYMRE